jgi:hypothetical protein
MKFIHAVATVTILLLVIAETASASEARNGNELYELLDSKSPYSRLVAQGYILGIIDTTRSLNRVWRLPARWTISPEITNGQIFEAVRKYLQQHPEERDKSAYISVNMALGSAFPSEK